MNNTPDEQGDYIGAFLCKKEVDQPDPSIEKAIESHVASEHIPVLPNGMISEEAKDRIDFLSGVSLILCRLANINNGHSTPPYPTEHEILGDLTVYFDYIKKIYPDLSVITDYHVLVCGVFSHDDIPNKDKQH
ncbi:hypothetical protein [Aeromonas caviae]|uniref:hypothetical protein n=1 Tax=Aeromonas caviae TaxID=648 RepID=UPI00385CC30B